jgi:hypothetical protein
MALFASFLTACGSEKEGPGWMFKCEDRIEHHMNRACVSEIPEGQWEIVDICMLEPRNTPGDMYTLKDLAFHGTLDPEPRGYGSVEEDGVRSFLSFSATITLDHYRDYSDPWQTEEVVCSDFPTSGFQFQGVSSRPDSCANEMSEDLVCECTGRTVVSWKDYPIDFPPPDSQQSLEVAISEDHPLAQVWSGCFVEDEGFLSGEFGHLVFHGPLSISHLILRPVESASE